MADTPVAETPPPSPHLTTPDASRVELHLEEQHDDVNITEKLSPEVNSLKEFVCCVENRSDELGATFRSCRAQIAWSPSCIGSAEEEQEAPAGGNGTPAILSDEWKMLQQLRSIIDKLYRDKLTPFLSNPKGQRLLSSSSAGAVALIAAQRVQVSIAMAQQLERLIAAYFVLIPEESLAHGACVLWPMIHHCTTLLFGLEATSCIEKANEEVHDVVWEAVQREVQRVHDTATAGEKAFKFQIRGLRPGSLPAARAAETACRRKQHFEDLCSKATGALHGWDASNPAEWLDVLGRVQGLRIVAQLASLGLPIVGSNMEANQSDLPVMCCDVVTHGDAHKLFKQVEVEWRTETAAQEEAFEGLVCQYLRRVGTNFNANVDFVLITSQLEQLLVNKVLVFRGYISSYEAMHRLLVAASRHAEMDDAALLDLRLKSVRDLLWYAVCFKELQSREYDVPRLMAQLAGMVNGMEPPRSRVELSFPQVRGGPS